MATRHGIFKISRHGLRRKSGEQHDQRRRSLSTPQDLNLLNSPESAVGNGTNDSKKTVTRKKSWGLTRLLRKGDTGSSHTHETPQAIEQNLEQLHIQSDLEFAHALMQDPAELATDLSRPDSETDLVQTICAPINFSKDAIRMDKKIHQISTANNRIATLSSLSGAAVVAKDYTALHFLQDNKKRISEQRATLFKQLDQLLTQFKKDPATIMSEFNFQPPTDNGAKVHFSIREEDEDTDSEDLRWERNSLILSVENTSEESGDEGLPAAELEHIAKEIRKTEGTRYKHKRRLGHRKKHEEDQFLRPPPPNPLGHTNRALMRSHTTVPSGLCQQTNSSVTSLDTYSKEHDGGGRSQKQSIGSNLPFNLLSLTGQLSWLVSEYVERNSSTYRWATELISQISKMSVTRVTWLNVHQQLRETTELLYKHRGRQQATHSESAHGEVAWNFLQSTYKSVIMRDHNAETMTVGRIATVLNSQPKEDKHLVHLSFLYSRKLHLAYISDLILWRAHKVLFEKVATDPANTAEHQLVDFRIRHMQLRLDQANTQNWSPSVIDGITRWIYNAVAPGQHIRKADEDNYYLNELSAMKLSVRQFQVLTQHLCDSEFLTEAYYETIQRSPSLSHGSEPSPQHHHHHHYHPHLHHHGESGHLQDLRPLDADRCSQTYSALVRSVHEHAMADRPLGYFAERALCDISMELDCQVDWKRRLTEVLDELVEAYKGWEELLMASLDLDFYQRLFEPKEGKS